jgi:tetratricopeptide (TPR) repeat protein
MFQTAVLILSLLLPRLPAPVLSVNIKDNALVGDIVTVTAMASSEAGITRVEFSVDDQLKATAMKRPYEYKWDTIDEEEGRHTLIIAAFDTDGKTATKRIKLEVDNGLSMGVKPHADKALAGFRKADFETAFLEGRKAYRIKNSDPDAIRAMAAGVGGRGDINRAIDLLEKPQNINNQVIGDPKIFPLADKDSLEVRGYFHLRRAALAADKGASPELATVFDLGRRSMAIHALETKAAHPTPYKTAVEQIIVGDALFAQGAFEAALEAYRAGPAPPKDTSSINHQALALIMMDRLVEAETILQEQITSGKANDATHAIMGAIYLHQHKYPRAHQEADGPAQRKSLVGLLVMAHADLSQRDFRGCIDSLKQLAERSDTVEVHYLASALAMDGKDLAKASVSAMEAISRAPALMEPYVLRAFQLATLVPTEGINQALPIFEVAMQREPKNQEARMGRATILMLQKKFKTAEPIIRELAREDRLSADVWVGMAALSAEENDRIKVMEQLAHAKRLEPELFPDTLVPRMPDFLVRVARYRRPPLITPALLAIEEAAK